MPVIEVPIVRDKVVVSLSPEIGLLIRGNLKRTVSNLPNRGSLSQYVVALPRVEEMFCHYFWCF